MERSDRRVEAATDPVAPADQSLTTSTESESFETWTLVTGGTKKHPTKADLEIEKPSDEEDRLELIGKDEHGKRDNENPDDLSDGISIISDNESAGRVSPPLIAEISSEFEGPGGRIQYEPLTPPASPREIGLCAKVETQIVGEMKCRPDRHSSEPGSSVPLLGIGVRGVFLAGILIAIAAFIAKLKYPEWEELSLRSQITPLHQRIEDLELQNNLLRAEIDLLNKQVKYLAEQKAKQMQKGEVEEPYRGHGEDRTRDGSKIWSGAGNLDAPEPAYAKPSSGKEYVKQKSANVDAGRDSKEFLEPEKYEREGRPHENRKYTSGRYDAKHAKHDPGTDRNWKKDNKPFNSREYFDDDSSREKHKKQRKKQWDYDQSREQYNGKRDRKREDDWHEKMMQHREESRKKQDQHNSKNWYIERGNGREEARVLDKTRP